MEKKLLGISTKKGRKKRKILEMKGLKFTLESEFKTLTNTDSNYERIRTTIKILSALIYTLEKIEDDSFTESAKIQIESKYVFDLLCEDNLPDESTSTDLFIKTLEVREYKCFLLDNETKNFVCLVQ